MRSLLCLLFALSSSGCVLSHSIAVTPSSLPVPAESVPTVRVESKGCTMFVFGFLPVTGKSSGGGLQPHSAYDLIQDASGGRPLAGVTIEEWQRLWLPLGLSHCTYVRGRLMELPGEMESDDDDE